MTQKATPPRETCPWEVVVSRLVGLLRVRSNPQLRRPSDPHENSLSTETSCDCLSRGERGPPTFSSRCTPCCAFQAGRLSLPAKVCRVHQAFSPAVQSGSRPQPWGTSWLTGLGLPGAALNLGSWGWCLTVASRSCFDQAPPGQDF